ncbi:hypothetical protein Pcinc_005721 [Petrolisthes cinctipes]|uniref:Reverse transcriptase n=1 Tax=Petrolisthes cinctipes TaxID=88211 RepID=A0AAE1GIS9_PETCI|nr:hypothetical protein Pcinc_005721 [Petrolisthes cinctipes]
MQELVQALGACSGTSPGPDEIRYEMIKHLDHGSMIKLLQVYNEIWRGQTFPNSWHFAHVIPIPKGGGSPRSTMSYRPIALTSVRRSIIVTAVLSLFCVASDGILFFSMVFSS